MRETKHNVFHFFFQQKSTTKIQISELYISFPESTWKAVSSFEKKIKEKKKQQRNPNHIANTQAKEQVAQEETGR